MFKCKILSVERYTKFKHNLKFPLYHYKSTDYVWEFSLASNLGKWVGRKGVMQNQAPNNVFFYKINVTLPNDNPLTYDE